MIPIKYIIAYYAVSQVW